MVNQNRKDVFTSGLKSFENIPLIQHAMLVKPGLLIAENRHLSCSRIFQILYSVDRSGTIGPRCGNLFRQNCHIQEKDVQYALAALQPINGPG